MRIGSLADSVGLTTKTLRFYEQAGLLPEPTRTPAGYRDYPVDAVARLAFIRHARSAGLTLAEIRGVLAIRDAGQPPCRHVTDLVDAHLAQVEQRITELSETRRELQRLRRRAGVTDPEDCVRSEVCSILVAP